MDRENIMFFKNQDGSYAMGIKVLAIIMILMLIKYYYIRKVIMNILLDIRI